MTYHGTYVNSIKYFWLFYYQVMCSSVVPTTLHMVTSPELRSRQRLSHRLDWVSIKGWVKYLRLRCWRVTHNALFRSFSACSIVDNLKDYGWVFLYHGYATQSANSRASFVLRHAKDLVRKKCRLKLHVSLILVTKEVRFSFVFFC